MDNSFELGLSVTLKLGRYGAINGSNQTANLKGKTDEEGENSKNKEEKKWEMKV